MKSNLKKKFSHISTLIDKGMIKSEVINNIGI